jgi:putative membrane protein insertion efficiency factor
MIARGFILLIRLYQKYLSPLKGATCRFHPSCSQYAIEAMRMHGAFRGFYLMIWRILRCQPFTRGGFDPVPPKHRSRNRG